MAKLNKLITYAYMREETDISQAIPDVELEGKINLAQETLRMLMGDEFYQDYLSVYKGVGFSGAYLTLEPYVKRYVAWQAHEFWIIKANFKVTAMGMRVMSEENSTPPTDVQMSGLIKFAKQQAQMYKKFMIDFLNGNYSNYPLYDHSCNNDLAGNSFHISAVKNKRHDHDCSCNRCRCNH